MTEEGREPDLGKKGTRLRMRRLETELGDRRKVLDEDRRNSEGVRV